jgi:hypothetical protein
MLGGDYYQRMASECFRFARESSDPRRKTFYLEMAQMWVRLAEDARDSERTEVPTLEEPPRSN